MPRRIPPSARAAALAAVLVAASVRAADGQMPGLPVLQNAFANPGITVAGNVGYSADALAYGAAAAWAPGSARYVISGGVGGLTTDVLSVDDEQVTVPAAGVRVSVPVALLWEDALGVAVFAGAGGATRDEWRQVDVPVGAGIGWRRAFGVSRGISVHAAPMIRWSRNSFEDGSSSSATLFRFAAGVDVTLSPSFGLTIGIETGPRDEDAAPTLARNVGGAGISYVFR